MIIWSKIIIKNKIIIKKVKFPPLEKFTISLNKAKALFPKLKKTLTIRLAILVI